MRVLPRLQCSDVIWRDQKKGGVTLPLKREGKKDVRHRFIDLHQQHPTLLLSAAELSYGSLHHTAVGRPAARAGREERTVLRFRTTGAAPRGCIEVITQRTPREVERATLSLS